MEMKESFDGGREGGRRGIPVDEIRRLIGPRERTSLLNYARGCNECGEPRSDDLANFHDRISLSILSRYSKVLGWQLSNCGFQLKLMTT